MKIDIPLYLAMISFHTAPSPSPVINTMTPLYEIQYASSSSNGDFLPEYYANVRKMKNLSHLESFLSLEHNWDGNSSEAFSPFLVAKAKEIVEQLKIQPKIFPTGRNSIQFEYEKKNGDYLEIEIFTENISGLNIIDGQEQSLSFNSTTQINESILSFHGA